jgi:LysM repeat protein
VRKIYALLTVVAALLGGGVLHARTIVSSQTSIQSAGFVQGDMVKVAPTTTPAPVLPQAPPCNLVQPGDSLSIVATRCGVDWVRLFDANPEVKDPDVISVGMTLRIPSPTEQLPHRPQSTRVAVHLASFRAESASPPPADGESSGSVDIGANRELGRQMAAERGWTGAEWSALDKRVTFESGWCPTRWNRYYGPCLDHATPRPSGSSGAYGTGMASPATKMAPYGADYMTNIHTQIKWMLDYIAATYGRPTGMPPVPRSY